MSLEDSTHRSSSDLVSLTFSVAAGSRDEQGLVSDLDRWGDRTSSLVTAYSGFSDFTCGKLSGRIRYAQVKGSLLNPEAWVGATEPIAPVAERVQFLKEFFEHAQRHQAQAFFMPVSEQLSEAASLFTHRICVGAEPIFLLDEPRFEEGLSSCLKKFPNARGLFNKGYRIESRSAGGIEPEIRREMARLEAEWKKSLRTDPMGFLNQINPDTFANTPYKKFFLLLSPDGRQLVSCLSALEIPARKGWYFTEVFRANDAPHGSTPLLMFGAMLELKKLGAREVHLGMAPLAFDAVASRWSRDLEKSRVERFLYKLSRNDSSLYGFRSAYLFKKRLQPSRWDPLFLIAAEQPSFRLLLQVVCAHFPGQSLSQILRTILSKSCDTQLMPWMSERALQVLRSASRSLPWATGLLALGLLSLHFLRPVLPGLNAIYAVSTYSPGDLNGIGWLLGPLFHNHLYHLFGDWISFLFFGGLVEYLLGRQMLIVVMALGFWTTNPLADGLVRLLHEWDALKVISDSAFQSFLTEQDRGSSNAVYAFVGALSVLLTPRLGRFLLVPFLANGVYLCWVRESWLSLHHLVGVALGFLAVKAWLLRHETKQR